MGLCITGVRTVTDEADQTEVFPDTPALKNSNVDKTLM